MNVFDVIVAVVVVVVVIGIVFGADVVFVETV